MAHIEQATADPLAANWPPPQSEQAFVVATFKGWYLPISQSLQVCVSVSPLPGHALPFTYLPDVQEYDDPPFEQVAQLCVSVLPVPSHGVPVLYRPDAQLVHPEQVLPVL